MSASGPGSGVTGIGTTGCHICCAFAAEYRCLSEPGIWPEASCTASQRARSFAPAAMAPAGPQFAPSAAERDLFLVEDLLRADAAKFADAAVRIGAICRDQPVHVIGDGLRHAGWHEDPVVDECLPGLAAHGLDQLTRHDVEHVVVGEARAEAGRRLQEAQAPHRIGAGDLGGRHEEQVTLPQSEAAAMHQQVADRHLARDPGVVHPEIRQVIDDRVVPVDLALVHEDRERGGREGLRGRTDLEQRVGVDRLRGVEAADAVSAGERDLAVLDDCDGGARHALLFHHRLDAGVEAFRRRGGGETRKDEKQDGE